MVLRLGFSASRGILENMGKDLAVEIRDAVAACTTDDQTRRRFLDRIASGLLTRDERADSHFCVYFLPFDEKTGRVFFVHHKKSGLWLSPGGHIDVGENLHQALNREIREELGLNEFFSRPPQPKFLSITPIDRPTQACKSHYDIWYVMQTDGGGFAIDPREFLATKWLDIQEAIALTDDRPHKMFLELLRDREKFFRL